MRVRASHDQSMPDRQTIGGIFPKKRSDWNQLLGIFGVVLGTILAACALLYIKQRAQLDREQSWSTAAATIRDTRTRLVSRTDSMYGGHMLYEVQVLATFSMNGSHQERWITVQQAPKTLSSAQFEESHWKGSQCIVRWKPSDPREIAIEVRQFLELR